MPLVDMVNWKAYHMNGTMKMEKNVSDMEWVVINKTDMMEMVVMNIAVVVSMHYPFTIRSR